MVAEQSCLSFCTRNKEIKSGSVSVSVGEQTLFEWWKYGHYLRLAAIGHSQAKYDDCDDVLKPVFQFDAMKFLLYYIALRYLELYKLAVNNEFFLSDLEEETFIEYPYFQKEVHKENIIEDVIK